MDVGFGYASPSEIYCKDVKSYLMQNKLVEA